MKMTDMLTMSVSPHRRFTMIFSSTTSAICQSQEKQLSAPPSFYVNLILRSQLDNFLYTKFSYFMNSAAGLPLKLDPPVWILRQL